MLQDARRIPPDSRLEAEFCIVGAGAAGITLAVELEARGRKVCLLESGGLEPEPASDALNRGETSGETELDLEASRTRGLGGGTRLWVGRCLPLDAVDLESRPQQAGSGWPFGAGELEPYYARARAHFGLAGSLAGPRRWEADASQRLGLDPELLALRCVEIRATRFGVRQRRRLERAAQLQLLLHANATHLAVEPRGRLARLRVRTLAGNAFEVSARHFVLAAGGIENPRLLLLSDDVEARGIGNANDLVGRYFMDHPHIDSAILSARGNPFPRGSLVRSRRPHGLFVLPEALRRAENLLGCAAYPRRPTPWAEAPAYASSGVASARALLSALREGRRPEQLGAQIAASLGGAGDVARTLAARLRGSLTPATQIVLRTMLEPEARPENRVRLLPETDALGLRRAAVHWSVGESERRSFQRFHEILGQEFQRLGLGSLELRVDPATWSPPLEEGNHHMGTTRMHDDPAHGVVDRHGRVHGVENLFIAGSSVFPSGGYANPTYTLVALAVRLADHLVEL